MQNELTRTQLLTVREIGDWLNVSESWVRDHATGRRRPVLPAIKLGKALRFDAAKVQAWLDTISTRN